MRHDKNLYIFDVLLFINPGLSSDGSAIFCIGHTARETEVWYPFLIFDSKFRAERAPKRPTSQAYEAFSSCVSPSLAIDGREETKKCQEQACRTPHLHREICIEFRDQVSSDDRACKGKRRRDGVHHSSPVAHSAIVDAWTVFNDVGNGCGW